jgi:hypothetical protein
MILPNDLRVGNLVKYSRHDLVVDKIKGKFVIVHGDHIVAAEEGYAETLDPIKLDNKVLAILDFNEVLFSYTKTLKSFVTKNFERKIIIKLHQGLDVSKITGVSLGEMDDAYHCKIEREFSINGKITNDIKFSGKILHLHHLQNVCYFLAKVELDIQPLVDLAVANNAFVSYIQSDY